VPTVTTRLLPDVIILQFCNCGLVELSLPQSETLVISSLLY
jgi:hypothetical protein